MLFNTYRNHSPFYQHFGQFFNEDFFHSDYEIPLNLNETETHYLINAKVPNVKKEDIQIHFENQILNIQYEIKTPSEGNLLFKDFSDGQYSRNIQLPSKVDELQIEAKLEKGILTVRLPKTQEAQAKKIAVK